MPTYEFRCPDGTVIEQFFKISEVPETLVLPDGTEAVRMISGGAGLVFKGSGFYITDYGKDGKKDLRQTASKPSASAASSDSASPSTSPSTSQGASPGTSTAPSATAKASSSTAPATSGSAA